MADLDDILYEKTHKEEGLDLGRRVFYTLSDDKSLQAHRNSKAIALLVGLLREKGHLSDEEMDKLLLECIQ